MAASQQQFSPVENPAQYLKENSDKIVKSVKSGLLNAACAGLINRTLHQAPCVITGKDSYYLGLDISLPLRPTE